jgi:hypothetical protein
MEMKDFTTIKIKNCLVNDYMEYLDNLEDHEVRYIASHGVITHYELTQTEEVEMLCSRKKERGV